MELKEERLSARQAVCVMVIYLCGSCVVLGGSTAAGRDAWICLVIAQAIAVPVLLVEARLLSLYPGKNLFGILEAAFGRVAGKIATGLMVWYAVHLCAMALRTYSEYAEIVAMPETPELPLLVLMLLVGAYLAKRGIGVMGKWAVGVFFLAFTFLVLIGMMLLNQMDFKNIFPILDNSMGTILSSSYGQFSLPFGESVLMLSVADKLPKKLKPGRFLFTGSVVAMLMLLWMMLRNLLALGAPLLKLETFPSYAAARIVDISDFLARIEGMISTNFLLLGVTRIAVCLLAASRGLSSLFRIEDDRAMVMPASLASLALAAVLAESFLEMLRFETVYPLYAVPFQLLIPLLAWICGEIKTHKNKAVRPRAKEAPQAPAADGPGV